MGKTTMQALAFAAFCLSKIGVSYVAYLAARDDVAHSGWFVFLAVVYVLGTGFKTTTNGGGNE